MYVIAQHEIKNAEAAFARGEALIKGDGAPAEARVLQFYPGDDGSVVVCLWEAPSVASVQSFADSTLGDSATTTTFAVDAEQAFSERPLGLREAPAPSKV